MPVFSHLFLDIESSDLGLVFEDESSHFRLPAHGFILKDKSRVFTMMLESCGFREERTKVVFLKGVHVQVAVEFLRFFYYGKVSDCPVTSLISLVHAGCMYDIPDLVTACDTELQSKVTISNASQIYQDLYILQSDVIQPTNSLSECLTVMCVAAKIVVLSDMYLTFHMLVFKAFLFTNFLNIESEQPVHEAILRWCRQQCNLQMLNSTDKNIRTVIGELLPDVRGKILHMRSDENLESYVARVFSGHIGVGVRVYGDTSLLKFRTTVETGNKPLVQCGRRYSNYSPHNTTKVPQRNLFHISADRQCFLLGFAISVLVQDGTNKSVECSSCDWQFVAGGTVECFRTTVSNLVSLPQRILFTVDVELSTPVELVPGKYCTVEYSGDRNVYFTSNDFSITQKQDGGTMFTIRSLKNIALTLHIYSA